VSQQRRLATTRTWFWFIVFATVVGGAVSFVASTLVPPTYSSQSTILVSPLPRVIQISIGDIDITRAAAATFSELATTRPVLERAIARTDVDTDVVALQKAVSTRVPVGTSLLEITVTAASPADAAELANAIAAELVAYPTPNTTDGASGWQVVVDVVDPAVPPLGSEGLGRVLSTILGAAIAMLIAIGLAFLVENLRAGNTGFDDDTPAGEASSRMTRANPPSRFDERGEVGRSTG
jgi:capsular polysaccharide biosynthesis protein